jgi:hypothetical protein
MERFWRSPEMLETVFKYLGLKKRLRLTTINRTLQDIIFSWLRRKQIKMRILPIAYDWPGRFPGNDFSSTSDLMLSEKCEESLSTILELLPNLRDLVITDAGLLASILEVVRKAPRPQNEVSPGKREKTELVSDGFNRWK